MSGNVTAQATHLLVWLLVGAIASVVACALQPRLRHRVGARTLASVYWLSLVPPIVAIQAGGWFKTSGPSAWGGVLVGLVVGAAVGGAISIWSTPAGTRVRRARAELRAEAFEHGERTWL